MDPHFTTTTTITTNDTMSSEASDYTTSATSMSSESSDSSASSILQPTRRPISACLAENPLALCTSTVRHWDEECALERTDRHNNTHKVHTIGTCVSILGWRCWCCDGFVMCYDTNCLNCGYPYGIESRTVWVIIKCNGSGENEAVVMEYQN